MKYQFVSIFFLLIAFNGFSQKTSSVVYKYSKEEITYDLKDGASLVLSRKDLSQLSNFVYNEHDSIIKQWIDKTKLYERYYNERDKVFQRMSNLPLPDFEAKDTEGYGHSTYKYRGRVLILHFWMFWGSSFDKEIPELNQLVDKYQKDGLAVLSLTSLPLGDSEKQKLKENPLNFPLIENAYQFTNEFFKMQLMRPCLIIVDKMGNMRYLYDGNLMESKMLNKNTHELSEFEQKIIDLLK